LKIPANFPPIDITNAKTGLVYQLVALPALFSEFPASESELATFALKVDSFANYPEGIQWTFRYSPHRTAEQAIKWVKEKLDAWFFNHRYSFMIMKDGELCGWISLWVSGQGYCETAWILHPNHSGVMTRAIVALIPALKEVGFTTIFHLSIEKVNVRSWKVAERAGFTPDCDVMSRASRYSFWTKHS